MIYVFQKMLPISAIHDFSVKNIDPASFTISHFFIQIPPLQFGKRYISTLSRLEQTYLKDIQKNVGQSIYLALSVFLGRCKVFIMQRTSYASDRNVANYRTYPAYFRLYSNLDFHNIYFIVAGSLILNYANVKIGAKKLNE